MEAGARDVSRSASNAPLVVNGIRSLKESHATSGTAFAHLTMKGSQETQNEM